MENVFSDAGENLKGCDGNASGMGKKKDKAD